MHLPFKYTLGAKARDRVTGFEGILTARHEYLFGCNRYSISPPKDKDGKLPDAYTFDEDSIEIIEENAVTAKPKNTGGPPSREPSRQD